MEFNRRFANGEQYIEIYDPNMMCDTTGEITEPTICEVDRKYYWEQKATYNKILPNGDSISVVSWNRNDCCFEITPLDSDVRFQLSDALVKEAVFVENKFDTIRKK